MNVVCHNDIGGVVVTNEQVSHYDALLYFKWIVYNHDRYCILTVTKAIEDTTLKNYLISYLLILTVIVSAMEVYIVGVKCNHKCKSKNATNNNRFNSNNAIRTARHRGRCSEGTRTLKQKRI
jgi:hypothetical protein